MGRVLVGRVLVGRVGVVMRGVLSAFWHSLTQVGRTAWEMAWFLVETLAANCRAGPSLRQWGMHMYTMAFCSIPLMAMTALFTGMVLALQTYSSFSQFAPEQVLPEVVLVSMLRELGPVLGGLMMAGRWGASIAAELATMRVTDQIDALITLSTNPFRYLVMPRLLAGVVSLPLLALVADVIGVWGGCLVSTKVSSMSATYYLSQTMTLLKGYDVACGLVKSAFFGFFIAFIGCYQGYKASGGAQGVGAATTQSVVHSCVMILCLNYILSLLFFQ
jgi:phospholipid/cholesterol/gamma-HCH transport system permease protein